MKKVISALAIASVILVSSTGVIEAKTKTKAKPIPAATALCKDGTLSYSKTHSGTCSHHKGVRIWYK